MGYLQSSKITEWTNPKRFCYDVLCEIKHRNDYNDFKAGIYVIDLPSNTANLYADITKHEFDCW